MSYRPYYIYLIYLSANILKLQIIIEMDGSDGYIYYIMEFIKRGRLGTRSIDIVPFKWLSFVKEKKIKCCFLAPPDEEEDFEMLQQLIDINADAPSSWPKYNVKIR